MDRWSIFLYGMKLQRLVKIQAKASPTQPLCELLLGRIPMIIIDCYWQIICATHYFMSASLWFLVKQDNSAVKCY